MGRVHQTKNWTKNDVNKNKASAKVWRSEQIVIFEKLQESHTLAKIRK